METAYIFPGIGLGSIVSRATRLRDEAFIAAAEALAALVTDGALLLPAHTCLAAGGEPLFGSLFSTLHTEYTVTTSGPGWLNLRLGIPAMC